ncbi:MarR family winged helix-turn-helix transcriptional regulator [Mycobacterium marseillense]|uniref:MarR family winged helix-turn-helix transcriptional regulator n=1 Tax=Mycobacterium marseillense TaxID=701042 RepID=UPI0009F69C04|nr:MarR family winged helix-turn-helix transcriptional regulator [Mycobacterium marseillense]MCV7406398.1 winged helix-turn-helix transcriptional regulator [Mycobacterium marseillense]
MDGSGPDKRDRLAALANGLGRPQPRLYHRHRTPGEAAAAVHVKTPTIVKMAARMTAAGLLVRRRDGHDSRPVRLWLTNKGRSLQLVHRRSPFYWSSLSQWTTRLPER